jgi:hypothetical protein
MKSIKLLSIVAAAALPSACEKSAAPPNASQEASNAPGSFGGDLAFLKQHTEIHVLEDPASGARVAVAPAWQGRVMTSSAGGDAGDSLGWIHYENVKTGILPPAERTGLARHIHVFGGEERFWLGPEGGQYALFFPPAPIPYTFENWFTPALIDTEAFDVVASDSKRIEFKKDASLINRAGTDLKLGINRSVELLDKAAIASVLKTAIPDKVAAVAYRSTNTLTNRGDSAWTKDSGLVSIWMLGMFKHGPGVTMVIPLKDGPGNAVNADYFGPLKSDRLITTDKAVFFKGDGEYRAKIGVPPGRSNGLAGSYDADRGRLTIVRCVLPPNAAELPYVRSQWMDHTEPYAGDLINAYNDGPSSPGEKPLGPFYELETSSPAMPLEPGQSITHVQETIHFQGDAKALDPIARAVLGVSLEEIAKAFPVAGDSK